MGTKAASRGARPTARARNFRLGEWLGDPVTPLFETWLLPRVEEAFSQRFQELFGFPARPPNHVVVNGWYSSRRSISCRAGRSK